MYSRSNKKKLLGFGTYKLDVSLPEMVELLKVANAAYYDFIDTASYYNNEAIIGEAIEEIQKAEIDFKLQIQTKVWPEDYLNTREAVLASMKRLKVKQLDCVLLHRPSFNLAHDVYAWKTLIEMKNEKLINEIGVSNYDVDMIDMLYAITGVYPTYNQIEFSVYNTRYDRYFKNKQRKINIQAWRVLTNDMNKLIADPLINELCEKYGTSPVGIAMGYCAALGVHVIVKSTNPNRVQSNADIFFSVDLEDVDVKRLIKLNVYDHSGSETYPITDFYVEKLKKQVEKLTEEIEIK